MTFDGVAIALGEPAKGPKAHHAAVVVQQHRRALDAERGAHSLERRLVHLLEVQRAVDRAREAEQLLGLEPAPFGVVARRAL